MQPVTVFAARDGRIVATQVTQAKDRRSRYRFVLAPGRYKISAPRSADKVPQVVMVHSRQTITVNFPNNCY
jgi:recombinational DNA repair protein (RecF pathway)